MNIVERKVETVQTKASLSGSERQRRYRETKKLCSIDIGRETLVLLDRLRVRLDKSTDSTIAAALVGLNAALDARSRAATRARLSVRTDAAAPKHRAEDGRTYARSKTSPGDTLDPGAPMAPPSSAKQRPTRSKGTQPSAGQKHPAVQFTLALVLSEPEPSI